MVALGTEDRRSATTLEMRVTGGPLTAKMV